MKTQNKKSTGKTIVGVAAGVAALSAAAYILFGPDGKKNRKVIRGWAVKMKGEIIEKLENAKEVTEPVYNQVVDQVMKKYSKIKTVDRKELSAIVADMRKHWKVIPKDTKKTTKRKKK